MKLAKKELQRLLLGALLLMAVFYGFLSLLIGPLKRREMNAASEIQTLEPQIAAAHTQIRKTEQLEAAAPGTQLKLDQITSLIPDGEPIAWFPPRVVDFFRRQGIEGVTVRLNNEFPEKDLPGFKKLSWTIEFAGVQFIPFAIALSALENEDPLLEITDLKVDVSGEDPEHQEVLVSVETLVKA
jgi:hypothetical protein